MSTSPLNQASSAPSLSAPEAYQRMLPEISAVPEAQLVHINLEVPLIVTTVLGTLTELRALRPRIVEELPRFNLTTFDALEWQARALSHAHALFVAATKPSMTLPELVEAGAKLRDLLHSDAMALVVRGLIDAAPLKDVKRSTGHRALAVDLQVLAATLQAAGPKLQGKSAVTTDEIDSAVHLADRLQDAVGLRDQGPQTVAETAAIRHRAFTLLVRSYDEARRAVSYLRWHEEDADTITPSFFAGRGGVRRREEGSADEPASAPTPRVSATPAAPPTPATPLNGPAGFPASAPFIKA